MPAVRHLALLRGDVALAMAIVWRLFARLDTVFAPGWL
jgi:hypothetical protein